MIAKHAIITDECRKNRTDVGAINEAVQRIVDEYMVCVEHWPLGNGTKFHVKLEIERPEPTPQICKHGIAITEYCEPCEIQDSKDGLIG